MALGVVVILAVELDVVRQRLETRMKSAQAEEKSVAEDQQVTDDQAVDSEEAQS